MQPVAAHLAVERLIAIFGVSGNGMANTGCMDADLMRPAGAWACSKETGELPICDGAKHRPRCLAGVVDSNQPFP